MSEITDIKPQVKCATRCNIYLDNTFYCGLELETVMRYRLKIGNIISKEELDEIVYNSEYTRALDKAMTYISHSQKTKKQVADYLAGKGYPQSTVTAVIDKLEEYRFTNDSEFAERYVSSYSKNKGKQLLKMELKSKGVSENDMKEALDNLEGEEENAYAVALKYTKNKQITVELASKCYRYLVSKGFSYDSAKYAVDKLKNGALDD